MANYYFIGPDGQSHTTVKPDELLLNGVTKDTLVWCYGMTNWAKAGDVAELKHLFEQTANINSNTESYNFTITPEPVGDLEKAVNRTENLGGCLCVLMWVGAIGGILIGIAMLKDNPILAGSLIGSSISTIIIASLLSSIITSITGLHNKIAKSKKR
jgi:hypothetical protein